MMDLSTLMGGDRGSLREGWWTFPFYTDLYLILSITEHFLHIYLWLYYYIDYIIIYFVFVYLLIIPH